MKKLITLNYGVAFLFSVFLLLSLSACSDVVSPDNESAISSEETDMQNVFGWNQGIGGAVNPGEVPDFSHTYDLIAGQDIPFGTVSMRKRGNNLNITFRLNREKVDDGWGIKTTHIWVGNDINNVPTSGGSGNLRFGHFPYQSENKEKPYPAGESISIDLTSEKLKDFDSSKCPMYIVAHTAISQLDSNGREVSSQTGFADENVGQTGNQWWRFVRIGCEGEQGGGSFTGTAGNRR